MNLRIALAGNPNCGKTTLFNALTGSNQFVGNWPGVTVEKKEGKLKGHEDVTVVDLPGIYSLSPYTPEEIVARNFLIGERPDVILDLVDGTNIERNLYLTTQLTEIGIPVVIAINMMDVVRRNGDKIDVPALSKKLGCPIVEISALKNTGITEAAEAAILAAKQGKTVPSHTFSGVVEHAIAHIEEAVLHELPDDQQRWYAVKIFERDSRVLDALKLDSTLLHHMETDIRTAETELDDDAESIITNERYNYIGEVVASCCKRKRKDSTVSDDIDRIVTNRFLGLPIFALVMFIIYYLSMVTVGSAATAWANEGLFGDGWHFLGIGSAAYQEASETYEAAVLARSTFEEKANDEVVPAYLIIPMTDSVTGEETEKVVYYDRVPSWVDYSKVSPLSYKEALAYFEKNGETAPNPADYGLFVPGIPSLIDKGLVAIGCAAWLKGLILDGIVSGVGAVLGFVPQMFMLFFMLSFLEACGYMTRIAFVLDRIFRKFGLSGKSFIPILIGTGCGVPGIMASRTIENESNRRMTVITTTFIPCGAKTPMIALIAGAVFGGSAWVATSAYFLGMAAIIVSGIMLKKTKPFRGEDTPFVMELSAYHFPMMSSVLRSMWDRGWSFVKKAVTVVLLSTVLVWSTTHFGFTENGFGMLGEEEIAHSLLAVFGSWIAGLFRPLGWGTWQATVATLTGIVAKENVVSTLGVLYSNGGSAYATLSSVFNAASGYSFLAFNLLCAPCVAAIGAIRREMSSGKWTVFAIIYQCSFAYAVSLMIYQFASLIGGTASALGVVAAAGVLAFMIFALVRPGTKKAA